MSGIRLKDNMRKLIIFTCILFSALIGVPAQKSLYESRVASAWEIPTVAYCELIHNAEKYDGKVVRTNATYRFGFEWAEFYCLDCWDGEHRTWVDYEDELCPKSKKIKGNNFRGRTVNVQVVGKFYGAGRMGYGHMNAYRYKFVVSCMERAKTIWNDSFVPSSLPADIAKKASCQADDSQR